MGASRRLQSLGALLLLAATLLSGCQQAQEPVAIVTLGPPLPPPATPTAKLAPTATPLVATVAPATATVTAAAETPTPLPAERPSEGIALTVLHTNDVYGYIDPCG